LVHGPEEKRGLAGRVAGCFISICAILTDNRPSLGKGVPPVEVGNLNQNSNRQRNMLLS
jgi:hypothetical protein